MFRLSPRRRERGATAIEYGLLASLIAVVMIVVVSLSGSALSNVFTSVGSAFAATEAGGDDNEATGPSCSGSTYTGTYDNWYWLRYDQYEHGSEVYYSTGTTWSGDAVPPDYSTPYAEADRGAFVKTYWLGAYYSDTYAGSTQMAHQPSGEVHPYNPCSPF